MYHGQYLTIEASLRGDASFGDQVLQPGLLHHLELISRFSDRCPEKVKEWEALLDRYSRAGKRVVLWGSGSKAVSFLTTLEGAEGKVEYVVDINPYRQGHFMPGTGQPILAPEQMDTKPPDVVVILNRVYRDEITSSLEELGLFPEVVAL